MSNYDAIVIGSGISGGWAAKELTEHGLRVLMLERGHPYEHIKDYKTASLDPWQFEHRGKVTQEKLKEHPYIAMFFLLFGAFAASGLDGVGGIPFLRAVRTHERQRMAAVYRTYIDFSDLIPAMIFAVALSYFEIGIVFIILGASLVLMGALAFRYLPKSM
jgi:hypothetical protein